MPLPPLRRSFRSVVKIHCVGAETSPLRPWQVGEQTEWTGSGFVISLPGGPFVVTNAHVVDNALVVRLSRQENPAKLHSTVLCTAYDLDLALVRVPPGMVNVPPLSVSEALPDLFSDVQALGYPEGGATICVTKGIVSRLDAQLYAFAQSKGFSELTMSSPGKLLVVQIDAAINSGNSGGPAVSHAGEVVGVASSALDHAQNVGYVIPSCMLLLFARHFHATGSWAGVSECGFAFRTMEGAALRACYGLGERTGVLITGLAPCGELRHAALPGDVLLALDGRAITNEGTSLIGECREEQLPLEHIVTCKPARVPTTVTLLRSGTVMERSVVFAPLRPLLPRYQHVDAKPAYAIFGGLVFTRLTMPLFHAILTDEDGACLAATGSLLALARRWRESEHEETVMLLDVLSHPVNDGITADTDLRVVVGVNDRPLASLAQLVHESLKTLVAAPSGASTFLRYSFAGTREGVLELPQEEVLRAQDVLEADEEILAQHGISAPVSGDLEDCYAAAAPKSHPCVAAWLCCLRTCTEARLDTMSKRRRKLADARGIDAACERPLSG